MLKFWGEKIILLYVQLLWPHCFVAALDLPSNLPYLSNLSDSLSSPHNIRTGPASFFYALDAIWEHIIIWVQELEESESGDGKQITPLTNITDAMKRLYREKKNKPDLLNWHHSPPFLLFIFSFNLIIAFKKIR